jgi:hypothetical protein
VTSSNHLEVGCSSSQVYPDLLRTRHMCEVIAEHRHMLVKFLALLHYHPPNCILHKK